MSQLHVVRVGLLGHIGRFRTTDGACFPRGTRVITRTARGLEVGQVLSGPDAMDAAVQPDGVLVRGMTAEDELLAARLEKNRHAAYLACCERLGATAPAVTLMEVEHLFDGQSLIFYFLGEPTDEVEQLTAELAQAYDAQAQLSRFAETLTAGCGPGCGTDEAAGHGCASCAAGCAVSGACGVSHR